MSVCTAGITFRIIIYNMAQSVSGGVKEHELQVITQGVEHCSCEKDQLVLQQGEFNDCLFILKEGLLRSSVSSHHTFLLELHRLMFIFHVYC